MTYWRTGNDILNGGAGSGLAMPRQAAVSLPTWRQGRFTHSKDHAVGDSITYGKVNITRSGRLPNWVMAVWSWWFNRRFCRVTVHWTRQPCDKDHEGHLVRESVGLTIMSMGGWTSTPDIVTLMIGTNDTRIRDISQMSVSWAAWLTTLLSSYLIHSCLWPQYHH